MDPLLRGTPDDLDRLAADPEPEVDADRGVGPDDRPTGRPPFRDVDEDEADPKDMTAREGGGTEEPEGEPPRDA